MPTHELQIVVSLNVTVRSMRTLPPGHTQRDPGRLSYLPTGTQLVGGRAGLTHLSPVSEATIPLCSLPSFTESWLPVLTTPVRGEWGWPGSLSRLL